MKMAGSFAPNTPTCRLCISCGPTTGKWSQGKHGLCRTCMTRENGYVSNAEREQQRIADEQVRLGKLQHKIPKPDGPRRIVVADGREFEVLWDGT